MMARLVCLAPPCGIDPFADRLVHRGGDLLIRSIRRALGQPRPAFLFPPLLHQSGASDTMVPGHDIQRQHDYAGLVSSGEVQSTGLTLGGLFGFAGNGPNFCRHHPAQSGGATTSLRSTAQNRCRTG